MLALDVLARQQADPDFLRRLPPVIGSPKVDAWRLLAGKNFHQLRSGKELRNKFARDSVLSCLESFGSAILDGELAVQRPNDFTPLTEAIRSYDKHFLPFNDVQSALSSYEGTPNVKFLLFDVVDDQTPFGARLSTLRSFAQLYTNDWRNRLHVLPSRLLQTAQDHAAYASECGLLGYEGYCFRNPLAYYKHGRGTTSDLCLAKVKTFLDTEARIDTFEPLRESIVASGVGPLGYAERSHRADTKQTVDKLGSLGVWHPKFGRFSVGSGFTDVEREEMWRNRESLRGKWITFKYQPHGTLDKPRSPIFKCICIERNI